MDEQDEIRPDDPVDIVIDTKGYSGNWSVASSELRIPCGRADVAEEIMAEISMRLERGKR